MKNDERDAKDLAAMLRLGRLAEGWIAPPETRELRELVRYRFSLVGHRTSAKAQIHGVMAKNGVLPVVGDMWGPSGTAQLDNLELPKAYTVRIESLRDLLEIYDREITMLDGQIHAELKDDAGYLAILQLPGVGKVLADDLRGRDRRRRSLRQPEEALFVGRAHPEAPRVRPERPPRVDHEAGITARTLGGHRGGRELPGPGQREATEDYRRIAERRGKYKARVAVGTEALDPRLLRPSRRRGPLSRRNRGRVSGGHGSTRARLSPWPAATGAAEQSD